MKVGVIGGGAVGLTAAYTLAAAEEPVDVTVFEAGEIPNGSTGRAAGVCYDAFADGTDADVAEEAIDRFRAFDGVGDFEFHECPYVWLAREGDERRAAAIREQLPRMQEHGRIVVELDQSDLEGRVPELRTDDVAVAAIAGAAGYTDPGSYASLLADLCRAEDVRIRQNATADLRLDPLVVEADDDGEREAFDHVLVAAGAHSKAALADVGLPIAMKPYRVQAATTSHESPSAMVYDATGGFYLRPHEAGVLAGDGSEEREADPDGYERDADDSFRASITERLNHRLTDTGGEIERAWAGLCTATPDRDPLLGELADGVSVATGFQGHGFMRAPALGRRVAGGILGDEGVPEFDPTRFDGDEAFAVVEGMLVEE